MSDHEAYDVIADEEEDGADEDKPPTEPEEEDLEDKQVMNAAEFRRVGKEMVDHIANYIETIETRRVIPEVQPGYLREMLPSEAPLEREPFDDIMFDVVNAIEPGLTHWCHPRFHAYFPAGNSFPSILGDMLSSAYGIIGFSWAASPSCTELEMLVLDWLAKMIGLPPVFLHENGLGGGVIQGSASECVLVSLLTARHSAMKDIKNRYPHVADGILLSKLVAYCSKFAHSCVEKAGMLACVKMRELQTDSDYSLRGQELLRAIEEDKKLGLIPFYVCCSIGTTSVCSFDNLHEIGLIAERENLWLHVDSAYAGSALICPEFQYLIKGIEFADSFNFNPTKWMLVNFDCSAFWVRDRKAIETALTVDPLYLQHHNSDKAVDFRHWGIPLSRRFRALKLWFVIRSYGVAGLQNYIRNHVELTQKFAQCVKQDDRFEIKGVPVLGLCCFRLVGDNYKTQMLLRAINMSGKIHMVPSLLDDDYVIRFSVNYEYATEDDILYAWNVISKMAHEVISACENNQESMWLVLERIASLDDEDELAEETSAAGDQVQPGEDEVFLYDANIPSLPSIYPDEAYPEELAAVRRRSKLQRMISDPRCYDGEVLKTVAGVKNKGGSEGDASSKSRSSVRLSKTNSLKQGSVDGGSGIANSVNEATSEKGRSASTVDKRGQ